MNARSQNYVKLDRNFLRTNMTLETEEAKLEKLRDEYKDVNDRVQKQYKKVENLRNKHTDALPPIMDMSLEDRSQVIEWAFSHTAADRKVKEWLESYHSSLSYNGWRHNDDYSQGWPCLQVSLQPGADVAGIAQAILAFRDDLSTVRDIPVPFDLGVFENTLSEFGVYFIEVTNMSEARLMRMTYGHSSEIMAGTLPEVLKYTSEHHPYDHH